MSWHLRGYGTVANGSNAASLVPPFPTGGSAPVAGDLCFLVFQCYGGTNSRIPQKPTGWTSIGGDTGWANGTAHHALYYRVFQTGDSAPTLTLSGTGAANDTQLSQIHVFYTDWGVKGLNQTGATSTNVSADNVGPITGITPTVGDLVIISCGKTNDWNGTATLASWSLSAQNESTTGNDAGDALLYQLASDGNATGNLTVTDNGGTASAGLGFGILASFTEKKFADLVDAIIDGLVSDGSEDHGFNVEVIAALHANPSSVVRTDNATVTITLPAVANYSITAAETVTATAPAGAVSGKAALEATPTFTIEVGATPKVVAVDAVLLQQDIPQSVTVSAVQERQGIAASVTVTGLLAQTYPLASAVTAVLQQTVPATIATTAVIERRDITPAVTVDALLAATYIWTVEVTGTCQRQGITSDVTVSGVLQGTDIAGSVTLSAVLQQTVAPSISTSAVIQQTDISSTVTISGYVVLQPTLDVSVAGVLQRAEIPLDVGVDAHLVLRPTLAVAGSAVLEQQGLTATVISSGVVQRTEILGSVTTSVVLARLDIPATIAVTGVVQRTVAQDVAVTGQLSAGHTLSTTVDGVLQQTVPLVVAGSAVALRTDMAAAVTVDAVLEGTVAQTVDTTAVLEQADITQTVTVSGNLCATWTATVAAAGVIQRADITQTVVTDGHLVLQPILNVGVTSVLQQTVPLTTAVSAYIIEAGKRVVTASGVLQRTAIALGASVDAAIVLRSELSSTTSAVLLQVLTPVVTVSAVLVTTVAASVTVAGVLQQSCTQQAAVSAVLERTELCVVAVSGYLQAGSETHSHSVTTSAVLQQTPSVAVSVSGVLQRTEALNVSVSAFVAAANSLVVSTDAVLAGAGELYVQVSACLRVSMRCRVALVECIPRLTIAVEAFVPQLTLASETWQGGTTVPFIQPGTDAEMRCTVTDMAGAAVSDATVTADVYDPHGDLIANDVACPYASERYVLSILSAWSMELGETVLGWYTVDFAVTRAGAHTTRRQHYIVAYAE